VVATHSPFLMAFPGAAIYEFTTSGIEPVAFDNLPAIDLWKRFFADPAGYYQRLVDDD
jgi:predicted ATPase